jgi:hyaluronoglucosaminidase
MVDYGINLLSIIGLLALMVKVKKRAFALSGVVEGFYGPPWSHEQRLEMIKFFGRECGFNIYIYAPKDDPFHRERWMEPYPSNQIGNLSELVRTCKEFGIEFCFAISPGLSLRYSSDDDFEKLTQKVEAVRSMGVRWFGLFFDDIPEELKHDEDRKAFGSLAEAQAHLTNRLEEFLRSRDEGSRLVICPTQYYLVEPTPYLQILGEKTSPSVLIMWTGRGVCSKELTCKDADTYASSIKRKPFVWDNYPVNDYNRNRLFLGPYMGREKELPLHISGIVSNPMNEAEASKIPLLTIADYLRNPNAYDPERSWRSALRRIGGKNAYSYLKLFAEQSRSSFLQEEESTRLKALIEGALEERNWRKSIASLDSYLVKLHSLRGRLSSTLKNKKLLADIMPYLVKLELLSTLGQRTVRLLFLLKTRKTEESAPLVRKLAIEVKELLAKCKEDDHQVCGEYKMRFSFEPGKPPPDKESLIVEFAEKTLSQMEGRQQV